jgi:hypothetical protein
MSMTCRPYNPMGPILIGALLRALRDPVGDAVGEGKRVVLHPSTVRHRVEE